MTVYGNYDVMSLHSDLAFRYLQCISLNIVQKILVVSEVVDTYVPSFC